MKRRLVAEFVFEPREDGKQHYEEAMDSLAEALVERMVGARAALRDQPMAHSAPVGIAAALTGSHPAPHREAHPHRGHATQG